MAANLKPPLLLLLCACACASTPPEQAEALEPRTAPASQSRGQSPAGAASALESDDFADLEASLEAYEQQLYSNEARLQAMGVLVAARENVARDAFAAEAEKPGTTTPSRFAPPPPARPAEPRAPLADGDEDQAARSKAKKAARPSSQPTPTAPTASPPSAGGGAGRNVQGTTSASPPRKPSRPSGPEGGPEQRWPEAARADAKTESKDADRGRCAEICDLADSTCDLEGKICDLAARHPGDARYAAVCQRAAEDCRIAAEACTQCSP